MNRENFLHLLTLKLSGALSAEQETQFKAACSANREYKLIADELLNDNLNETGHLINPSEQLDAVWNTIVSLKNQPAEEPKRTYHLPYLLRVAAAVLLIVIGGILWHYYTPMPLINQFSVNAGEHKIYKTLDDGTIICLNRNSGIRYNQDFGKTKREITLKGEAFFDVAKNAAVPLFIHVSHVTIEVKGTAFNVSERQEHKQVEIALIRGTIEVSNTLNRGQTIALSPNQKLVVSTDALQKGRPYQILPLGQDQQANTLRWTRDSLVFKKEKLVNLAILLEKKYQVKIEIQNEKLKLKQFTGVIKGEQLTEALDALKLSCPFTYAINNKIVIIK